MNRSIESQRMQRSARHSERSLGRKVVPVTRLASALVVGAILVLPTEVIAQGLTFNKGQSISPAFEGWEENEDGSFNIVFGYMNRNWEGEVDLSPGPDNGFSPGPADRGQPTHFLPRRNRFVFRVQVPADFGDQELVWTLRSDGETLKAYGSLRPDYFIDNVVMMSETGTLGAGTSDPELRAHAPPSLTLETPTEIEAQVGERVQLVAHVTDDGLPRADPGRLPLTDEGELDFDLAVNRFIPVRITVDKTVGLHMAWFVYRGPEEVNAQEAISLDPPQVHVWEDTRPYSNSPWAPFWIPPEPPEDGRWITEVIFQEPGTYVLRGRADDGGLFTDTDVTVRVQP
ncbi:MAG: hypothetical protein GEU90_11520 [Gemmatimonas sp.]|nr:hypothetical protein [Gemmatimonas sp.]